MSARLYLSESPEERAMRAERVARERVAQGLPPKVTDPAAYAFTAQIMRRHAERVAREVMAAEATPLDAA